MSKNDFSNTKHDEFNPIAEVCIGCGSTWSDARLNFEKLSRLELLSCCPDRKMIKVYSQEIIDKLKVEIEALKADNQKAYAYIAKLANDMGKAQEK